MTKKYTHLKETKIFSKKVHKGVVDFNVDTVRLINGATATREYMVHPGASAILPIKGDKVILVQQYRYPVGLVTWEVPAGKMKKGQTPLAAAKAELQEETGYTGKIKKLISFHPCCAFSDEILHIFTATDLKPGPTNPDEDEFLNTKEFTFKKAFEMVEKGEIKDAKTIIALSLYKNTQK
ncbi:ADP-ribose pyrophosphatase [Elusimicrobium posterum]|uniref:NUDIX hydrolase n=1 Tax=Elusimicrobium posterum TaxID=3116653 RepID=UPI003C709213